MSTIFFALYGLSSIAMIVTVFSILFRIFGGTRSEELHQYFIAIVLLVVFKGICNMIADMKKHSGNDNGGIHSSCSCVLSYDN